MQNDFKYWLAAVHAQGITPRHFLQWLPIFKDMSSLFMASDEEWRAQGISDVHRKALATPAWKEVELSLKWMEQKNCHIITLADSNYPYLLKEISDPPLILFVQGRASLLTAKQIGMVGAREVTPYGEKNAFQFAEALSKAGYVITSGLARGVDAASHRGALAASGETIAVAGTGLQHVYPAEHRRLAADIIEKGGALVSEFPLAATPRPYHFPRRNRIISGLSKGVLVIEAALQSGSLVTARHAMEQGREVFAIPGSIHSPVAKGCHALIRQGAKLVESASDIFEEFSDYAPPIQVEFSRPLAIIPETLNDGAQLIYSHVGTTVTSLDEIILRSGLTDGAVSSILLSLELEGHIQSVTGGYVR